MLPVVLAVSRAGATMAIRRAERLILGKRATTRSYMYVCIHVCMCVGAISPMLQRVAQIRFRFQTRAPFVDLRAWDLQRDNALLLMPSSPSSGMGRGLFGAASLLVLVADCIL